jgi:hypothetical protein
VARKSHAKTQRIGRQEAQTFGPCFAWTAKRRMRTAKSCYTFGLHIPPPVFRASSSVSLLNPILCFFA